MTGGRGFRVIRALLMLAFAAYFFLPLFSMLNFSLQGKGPLDGTLTLEYYRELIRDADLRQAIIASLLLALLTVLLMVALLVPTMIWVRLRVPGLSRTVEFLCLLPLTVPPLVIVVGITNVYTWVNYLLGDSPLVLTFAYVILVLPCGFTIPQSLADIPLLTARPGWRELKAVRDGRVFVIDGHHYFNRPGPRLVESAEMIAEILHPRLFGFGHEGSGWVRLREA